MFKTLYVKPIVRVHPDLKSDGLTHGEHKYDCDVNHILDMHRRTGTINVMNNPIYGDFSDVGDFKSANDLLLKANQQFNSLPAKVRRLFVDPAGMLEYFSDNPVNDINEIVAELYPDEKESVTANDVVESVKADLDKVDDQPEI